MIPAGLLLLVGPPAAGKSTFASELVRLGRIDAAGVVSCDAIRVAMAGGAVRVSDDPAIFAEMDRRVGARLAAGLPVIVDATNVTVAGRARMLAHARTHRRPSTALRFPVDEGVLLARNAARTGHRLVPPGDVVSYAALFHSGASRPQLTAEGLDQIHDVPADAGPAAAAHRFTIAT
ncbi:MAG: ATP-binding protein, partial [Propionibacteriaceae bacterium]